MHDYQDISNSQLSAYIDEWIKSERDHAILKRRLIDHICYEPLAEEFGLSDRHIKTIVYKNEELLFRKIDEHEKDKAWADRLCLNQITYYVLCGK